MELESSRKQILDSRMEIIVAIFIAIILVRLINPPDVGMSKEESQGSTLAAALILIVVVAVMVALCDGSGGHPDTPTPPRHR